MEERFASRPMAVVADSFNSAVGFYFGNKDFSQGK